MDVVLSKFDGQIDAILACGDKILESNNENVKTNLLKILDEKITRLHCALSESPDRSFHIGHTDALHTILHELKVDMQRDHNTDNDCIQCELSTVFFAIADLTIGEVEDTD